MGCISLPGGKFSSVPEESFVALGCFDGLHAGHRALLAHAADAAGAACLPLAVWSPEGAKDAPRIGFPSVRRDRLARLGVRYLFEDRYEEIRALSPRAFFEEYLIGKYRAAGVACGENFTFGAARAGDAGTLGALCAEYGVRFFSEPCVTVGGTAVSDSRVRELLQKGNAEEARVLLQAPYAFDARAVSGRHVGRTIGFPTINLPLPPGFLLPFGVYAALLAFDAPDGRKICRAAADVGVHPTFGSADLPRCEVHLLEPFLPEKGKLLRVGFMTYVRPEESFRSADELKDRIKTDVEVISRYFDRLPAKAFDV
ncbi:MAG: hypothetical protein IJU52_03720 [Clostridia bacterium]|nr:hypothetical protein [Clostridia bacterium]